MVVIAGDFVQAADMRNSLWRIVDAVDVAVKVTCATEYERVRSQCYFSLTFRCCCC